VTVVEHAHGVRQHGPARRRRSRVTWPPRGRGWRHEARVTGVDERTVYAHRLDAGEWRVVGTYHDEIEARIEPFEAVTLNVARWWAS
jgi:hypothetical protein